VLSICSAVVVDSAVVVCSLFVPFVVHVVRSALFCVVVHVSFSVTRYSVRFVVVVGFCSLFGGTLVDLRLR
jgi:hypothetical protein